MVRELVETTVSGDLDPVVRKRLTDITQLIQSYCRLAELEVASGDAPRFPGRGYAALPGDTSEKAKERAEGEAEKEHQREAFEKDSRAALEAME
jgi:hypothetical protein